MQKYSILLGYWQKQMAFIRRMYNEVTSIGLEEYETRYVFALKLQQLYTAIEDLFKQIAKCFENNIENLGSYHSELLVRLNTDIPKIRPAVISHESFMLLNTVRKFRHFIRHAYDCELDQGELQTLSDRLKKDFSLVETDLDRFEEYISELATHFPL